MDFYKCSKQVKQLCIKKLKKVFAMANLLSVIVPVYNVEKYLPKCIETILNQTFKDFELILVNDGSTDNCPIICEEYAKKDERIKVIHKENGGLSDARNTGIDIAQGKYISFIDSDDFIIENTYDILVGEAETNNLDIIIGNAINYFSEDEQKLKMRKRSFPNEVINGTEFLKRSYVEKAMVHCVVAGIYRTKLIKENKLFFKKSIYHEDNLWTPQIFLKAERVMYYDLDFYRHVQRKGSITKLEDKTKNGIDLLNICYELAVIYENIQDEETKKILNDVLVSLYLRAVSIGKLTRNEYKKMINKEFLLGKSLRLKNKIKSALFIISPVLYVKLFSIVYR